MFWCFLTILVSICVDARKLGTDKNVYSDTGSGSIEALYCIFHRTTVYDGYGSIIGIKTDKQINLKVEHCDFYNCITSKAAAMIGGGAIYFDADYSSVFLDSNCVKKCYNTMRYDYAPGQFACIVVSAGYKYHVTLNTISSCSDSASIKIVAPLFLHGGEQKCLQTNFSRNYAYRMSSVWFHQFDSVDCSYCTMANGISSGSQAIEVQGTHTANIEYSNIVGNNSPSPGIVRIWSGTLYMSKCIFNDNQNSLFYRYGGVFTVSNSYINHPSQSLGNAAHSSSGNQYIITKTYNDFHNVICGSTLFHSLEDRRHPISLFFVVSLILFL